MRIHCRPGLPLIAAVLCGLVPGSWADAGPGSKRISVDVGAAFPTPAHGFSDASKTGLVGGIQYLHNMNYFTAVGLQAAQYQFDGKEHAVTSSAGGRLNADSQASVTVCEIVARYTFAPAARLMPYVHSGLGANLFRQSSDGTPLPGFTWADTNTRETRQLPDVHTAGVSFSIGAGIETNMSSRVVLGTEATWRILGIGKAAYGSTSIHVPSLSMRLGWRFGHEPLPPEN